MDGDAMAATSDGLDARGASWHDAADAVLMVVAAPWPAGRDTYANVMVTTCASIRLQ